MELSGVILSKPPSAAVACGWVAGMVGVIGSSADPGLSPDSADRFPGLEWDAELVHGRQEPGNGCSEKDGPLVSEGVGSRPQPR